MNNNNNENEKIIGNVESSNQNEHIIGIESSSTGENAEVQNIQKGIINKLSDETTNMLFDKKQEIEQWQNKLKNNKSIDFKNPKRIIQSTYNKYFNKHNINFKNNIKLINDAGAKYFEYVVAYENTLELVKNGMTITNTGELIERHKIKVFSKNNGMKRAKLDLLNVGNYMFDLNMKTPTLTNELLSGANQSIDNVFMNSFQFNQNPERIINSLNKTEANIFTILHKLAIMHQISIYTDLIKDINLDTKYKLVDNKDPIYFINQKSFAENSVTYNMLSKDGSIIMNGLGSNLLPAIITAKLSFISIFPNFVNHGTSNDRYSNLDIDYMETINTSPIYILTEDILEAQHLVNNLRYTNLIEKLKIENVLNYLIKYFGGDVISTMFNNISTNIQYLAQFKEPYLPKVVFPKVTGIVSFTSEVKINEFTIRTVINDNTNKLITNTLIIDQISKTFNYIHTTSIYTGDYQGEQNSIRNTVNIIKTDLDKTAQLIKSKTNIGFNTKWFTNNFINSYKDDYLGIDTMNSENNYQDQIITINNYPTTIQLYTLDGKYENWENSKTKIKLIKTEWQSTAVKTSFEQKTAIKLLNIQNVTNVDKQVDVNSNYVTPSQILYSFNDYGQFRRAGDGEITIKLDYIDTTIIHDEDVIIEKPIAPIQLTDYYTTRQLDSHVVSQVYERTEGDEYPFSIINNKDDSGGSDVVQIDKGYESTSDKNAEESKVQELQKPEDPLIVRPKIDIRKSETSKRGFGPIKKQQKSEQNKQDSSNNKNGKRQSKT